MLYIVNKRHDITEHKNQKKIVKASKKYCTKNRCKNGRKIPISKIT
jgi:hypothetical protein